VAFAHQNTGVLALKELLEAGDEIEMVYCHEPSDDEVVWYRSVKRFCQQHDLDWRAPDSIGEREIQEVQQIEPDVVLSCYTRHILPEPILEAAEIGAFNVHPSLLPKYRGCFSAPWAIIKGETKTGVTIHEMEPSIDTGDIVAQRDVPIYRDDTGFKLYRRLQDEAIKLLQSMLDDFREADYEAREQDPKQGNYYPRQLPFEGVVDWSQSARQIFDFVRAIAFRVDGDRTEGFVGSPRIYPGATSQFRDMTIHLWDVDVLEPSETQHAPTPGTVVDIRRDRGPVVQTGNGRVLLRQIRPENSLEMTGARFAEEYGIEEDERLVGGRWDTDRDVLDTRCWEALAISREVQ
jgi:UDP-4-amino-4-deoxy-L-arabinose formyltransferase/UDP-glucuronic acid dehydrogenase (UDP-4-keto-hexauronic acid decarboxylating)